MSRKLIFGFMPENDPELEGLGVQAIAVSFEDDFVEHGCFSYTYPEETHQMFRGWESAGICELMESIFEYPKGKQDFIKTYLEYNGVTYSPEFETFLAQSAE